VPRPSEGTLRASGPWDSGSLCRSALSAPGTRWRTLAVCGPRATFCDGRWLALGCCLVGSHCDGGYVTGALGDEISARRWSAAGVLGVAGSLPVFSLPLRW